MDISTLSVEQLVELQVQLPKALESRRNKERASVKKDVEAYAQQRGFTIAELFGNLAGKPKNTRKQAKIKYRHPDDATLTWTGRGRDPKWIMAWKASGKTLEQCAI
jgi:DNA-binding protein H-NS